jgi:hypothetical protein
LRRLFDSSTLFSGQARTGEIYWFTYGAVTPGDPERTFDFFERNHLLSTGLEETVFAALQWCSTNLAHFDGGMDVGACRRIWQYDGLPPVERVLEGTIDPINIGYGRRPWTMGCWGTAGLLSVLLRTANIPAKMTTLEIVENGYHASAEFKLSPSRYLSHGDDPYNWLVRPATPPVPMEKLLLSAGTYFSWFSGPFEQTRMNVGRRAREVGIEYLSDWLLDDYCDDKLHDRSKEQSKVWHDIRGGTGAQPFISIEELEARQLWERLEAKARALGWCSDSSTLGAARLYADRPKVFDPRTLRKSRRVSS